MQQPAQQIKTCPRCHQPFVCKANNIANCQCQGIVIDAEMWDFISRTYEDCLCKDCLLQIGDKYLSDDKL